MIARTKRQVPARGAVVSSEAGSGSVFRILLPER